MMNKKKCGIFKIAKRATKITYINNLRQEKELQIKEIPLVKSYKYLGIVFDPSLSFNLHYAQLKTKVYNLAKHLKKISTEKTSILLKIKMYRSYILSLITYTSCLIPFIKESSIKYK